MLKIAESEDRTVNLHHLMDFGEEPFTKGRKNIALYLPESFEWLILSTGILKNNFIDEILSNTSEYVECKDYFSWERFFTSVLIKETEGTYLAYAKKNLNDAYLSDTIKLSILRQMEKIKFS